MKKILSVIVVAALGWVAFDRVTLALELRSKADALKRTAYKAATGAAYTTALDAARDAAAAARDPTNTAALAVAAVAAALAVAIHLNRKTPTA